MPPPKQKVIHDKDLINLAIKEVAATGKLREIARKYGIPKSTLHFKMKNPGHRAAFGPPPVLTTNEEEVLEKWIVQLSKKGFPLKKEDLQSSVQKFLRDNPRPNNFRDNYPSAGWVRGFLKIHPNIASRTSEGVTQSSACVSESDIRKWFLEIHRYLEDNNLLEVLNDSSRIYNGDESGFHLCPKTGKVLAAKGSKNVYTVDSNKSKESITVMFTFSADGQACPPMVVYNYVRIPQKVSESVPNGWGIGRSESGWMTSELFFEYIANIFHPYLIKKGIALPVVYFLDGHKTHLTYEVSKLCKALKIELIALYPNATRILQPADVAVFRPVKAAWRDASRIWLMDHPNEIITKVNFAKVLDVALKKAVKPETLINGFKACGLMPFNPDAVDYSKCLAQNKQCEQEKIEPPMLGNVETLASENFITWSKFKDLLGPKKIEELKTCDNTSEKDENFQLLLKLYNTLDCAAVRHKELLQRSSLPVIIESQHVQALQDEKSPFIEDSQYGAIRGAALLSTEKQKNHETSPSVDALSQSLLLPDIQSCNSNYSQNVIALTTTAEIHNETSRVDDETIAILSALPELLGIDERTPSKNPGQQTKNDDLENSPAFKIVSTSLFGSYLTVPKTPERKGKKNTLRMPFAVTSNSYRAMFKEQKEKKDMELKKKEERKRLRKETKLKKENEKKVKGKKEIKTQQNIAVTHACTICLKTTKLSNRVTCDMCTLIYHVKCVPKNTKNMYRKM